MQISLHLHIITNGVSKASNISNKLVFFKELEAILDLGFKILFLNMLQTNARTPHLTITQCTMVSSTTFLPHLLNLCILTGGLDFMVFLPTEG